VQLRKRADLAGKIPGVTEEPVLGFRRFLFKFRLAKKVVVIVA
jgi:hypothetical protein